LGGNTKLMRDLAKLFRTEYPKSLSRVEQAVAAQDSKALEQAAHSLKGSLSTMAAKPASELALQLEMMARQGDLQSVNALYAALTTELGRLEPQLAALAKEVA
ncbi:MAG: Hpt domain-containing protein, partial [Acidobacteria bacterium]|nr:Hpt domain-containing protein [Acidobacteriota bacterium]